jgi:hypothetical protein
MVKLGPSRAEHETGGEAISAETIRRPPRHPMTQLASPAGDFVLGSGNTHQTAGPQPLRPLVP